MSYFSSLVGETWVLASSLHSLLNAIFKNLLVVPCLSIGRLGRGVYVSACEGGEQGVGVQPWCQLLREVPYPFWELQLPRVDSTGTACENLSSLLLLLGWRGAAGFRQAINQWESLGLSSRPAIQEQEGQVKGRGLSLIDAKCTEDRAGSQGVPLLERKNY